MYIIRLFLSVICHLWTAFSHSVKRDVHLKFPFNYCGIWWQTNSCCLSCQRYPAHKVNPYLLLTRTVCKNSLTEILHSYAVLHRLGNKNEAHIYVIWKNFRWQIYVFALRLNVNCCLIYCWTRFRKYLG